MECEALQRWAEACGLFYNRSQLLRPWKSRDLHDETVVRMPGTDELAVIDPCISLVRRGTWAAMKLAEIGFPPPPDDLPSA